MAAVKRPAQVRWLYCVGIAAPCGAECVLAWVSHLSVSRTTPAPGPVSQRMSSLGVGSRRPWASLHQHISDQRLSGRCSPLNRPTCGGDWLRCAIDAIGSLYALQHTLETESCVWDSHRSIRPESKRWVAVMATPLVRGAAPGKRSRCTADQRHARCLRRDQQ